MCVCIPVITGRAILPYVAHLHDGDDDNCDDDGDGDGGEDGGDNGDGDGDSNDVVAMFSPHSDPPQ
jgi:hypothetical protein